MKLGTQAKWRIQAATIPLQKLDKQRFKTDANQHRAARRLSMDAKTLSKLFAQHKHRKAASKGRGTDHRAVQNNALTRCGKRNANDQGIDGGGDGFDKEPHQVRCEDAASPGLCISCNASRIILPPTMPRITNETIPA